MGRRGLPLKIPPRPPAPDRQRPENPRPHQSPLAGHLLPHQEPGQQKQRDDRNVSRNDGRLDQTPPLEAARDRLSVRAGLRHQKVKRQNFTFRSHSTHFPVQKSCNPNPCCPCSTRTYSTSTPA